MTIFLEGVKNSSVIQSALDPFQEDWRTLSGNAAKLAKHRGKLAEMSTEERTLLVDALIASQSQLIDFFSTIDDPEQQPGAGQWSVRQIAWHLATVEKTCLWPRIQQIAMGTNPTFGIYLDTETEFNTRSLTMALEQWQTARRDVLDLVNSLEPDALAHTGTHPTFGRLTILGYLQIFLDHDQRHLGELEEGG